MLNALLRGQIRKLVLRTFPRGQSGIDYAAPVGDPGLFGPDSVTWRIHADFPGMLSGGLCALFLQTLHPLALAGVYDHSNFRHDLVGRLRRTTTFVAGTTYASHADARALIARVDAIHARVHGVTTDGVAYRAQDPALLTWVHATESYGFVQGFRRYGPIALPPELEDRYYAEGRIVAEALGARGVPDSRVAMADYFAQVRAQLRFDARSAEVLDVLSRIKLPVPVAALSRSLFLGAGAALLPNWALQRLPITTLSRTQAAVAARALQALAPVFRAALPDGIAPAACARVGRSPDILRRWPD